MKKLILLLIVLFVSITTFGQTFFSKGMISNGDIIVKNNAGMAINGDTVNHIYSSGDSLIFTTKGGKKFKALANPVDQNILDKKFGVIDSIRVSITGDSTIFFSGPDTVMIGLLNPSTDPTANCENLHAYISVTNSGVLDCDNSFIELTGSSNQADVSYQWDGSTSGDLGTDNPLSAFLEETITLTVTNNTTACEVTKDFAITTDDTQPIIESFKVSQTDTTLVLGSFVTNQRAGREYNYSWTGSGILTDEDAQLVKIDVTPGDYTIQITDVNNGCYDSEVLSISYEDFFISTKKITSDTLIVGNDTLVGGGTGLPAGVQGDILYNNGTDWVVLNAGTDGDLLQTHGSGANPQWLTPVEIPYGFSIQAYAAGTAYNLTASSALIDFGTTDPSVTITQAGTYKITAGFYYDYSGATFAGNETVTAKLRRTNNTAADVSNSTIPNITLDIVTTFTGGGAFVQLPPVVYTTVNTDDILQLWGNLSANPSAGNMRATGAWINAERVY